MEIIIFCNLLTLSQSLKYHEGGQSVPHSLSCSGLGPLQAESRRCLPVPPIHKTPLTCLPAQLEEHVDQSPAES